MLKKDERGLNEAEWKISIDRIWKNVGVRRNEKKELKILFYSFAVFFSLNDKLDEKETEERWGGGRKYS